MRFYLRQLRSGGEKGNARPPFLTISGLLTVADPPPPPPLFPLRPPRTVPSMYTKRGKTNLRLHTRTHTNTQWSDKSVWIKSRPGDHTWYACTPLTHHSPTHPLPPPPPPPPLLETFKETSRSLLLAAEGTEIRVNTSLSLPSVFPTRSHRALCELESSPRFESNSFFLAHRKIIVPLIQYKLP